LDDIKFLFDDSAYRYAYSNDEEYLNKHGQCKNILSKNPTDMI